MPQPGTNLSAFDAVLKEIYLGPVRDQLNHSTILMTRLEKNSDDVDYGGKRAVVPLHVGRNSGIGARGENDTLPRAGRQAYKDAIYQCAYNYAIIQVPGPTIKASRTNKYAFVRAVESELEGAVRDLKDEMNVQLWGNGTGVIATVNGDPLAQEVTVSNPGNMYFQTDMLIDFVDPSSTIPGDARSEATQLRVVEKSGTDKIILLETAPTAIADGDYIARHGNYHRVMMGISGIVSDVNPGAGLTVGQIDRSSVGNGFWKGKVFDNGGTARALDLDLMQQCFDAGEEDGGSVSLILSSYAVRRRYLSLLKEDNRFVNTMKLDGGFDAIEYNGKPMVVDRHCPPGSLWFLDEKTLAMYRMSDFDWMDDDGSVLSRVDGVDAYSAVLYHYGTLGCSACNRNSVIKDLETSPPVA